MKLTSATQLLITYQDVEVLQDMDTLEIFVKTQSKRKFKATVDYLFDEGFLEGNGVKLRMA